ncbi:DUF1501 domain-containing protein [Lignipirellula cremea]|uniref:DUF1501 domain-containing protein n=1 Tax=Lignipirellula cremea TaxID=2528010 RepID=A0A518DQ50_9BACT|nr:DUF1501 domain-containing protein [Lignipirellula cremea]QDU93957.1 hypothetical protein Pla8534_17430 [Lignipirellula cremea]
MRRDAGCPRLDHLLSRRSFMAATGAAAAGIGLAGALPAVATAALVGKQKRVLQIYLQGGLSQLESWDPKPGTRYGGPFRAIPTSTPGTHISELLPHTAQRMHLLSIVRSINIKTGDHGQGRLFMEMGRRAGAFPYLGSVASRYLTPASAELPGYIHISGRGLNDNTSAFLGARYSQLKLTGPEAPPNLESPAGVTAEAARRQEEFRQRISARFASRGGQPALTEAFESSYSMADKLMQRQSLFEQEPTAKEKERYGEHDFGVNCLLAKRLLENGATCVKVTHHGYDTHAENFNFHLEQLGEFDRTFSMLLDDIYDAGMLDSTLVMVMSEFGRTPKINQRYGRDHWGTAWSIALGGCGIQPGAVIGSTNEEGTAVADREVDAGHLFHTYLQALGIDSYSNHDLGGRTVPMGDPAKSPIKELLA